MTLKLALCASGQGTLLNAFIEADVPIQLIVFDRECPAMEIARKSSAHRLHLPRKLGKETFDRDAYTAAFHTELCREDIGLVAMAGFDTILSSLIFAEDAYFMKITNTHPSLLPLHKGHYAVRDTLAAGDRVTGFTIHYATPELDNGPIIRQEQVPVLPGDTISVLHERIKRSERRVYPEVIRELMAA